MATNYKDYINEDYRAFLFATHPAYGMLLLHCTRKKKKPPHFQAPGGHVDKEDFEDAVARLPESSHEGPDILIHASKIGAARELFEETGIDLRSSLDRFQPARLRDNSKDKLICEFKKRMFFKICLGDGDFVTSGIESKVGLGLTQPLNDTPPHLMLKLSHEHQGFKFEPDTATTVDLLVHHSGGKVSEALRRAIEQGDIESVEIETKVDAEPNVEGNVNIIVGNPVEGEIDDTSEKKWKLFDCFNCC